MPLRCWRFWPRVLERMFCQKIVLNELPWAIPNTSVDEVARVMPLTAALPIGSYLGVPVHLADGRPYGTLCCLSHAPNPRFDKAAVAFLENVANSLSRVLGSEELERAGRRHVLAAIDDILGRDAVRMVYQPVVNLRTGDVVGVEALARFEDLSRTTSEVADYPSVRRALEPWRARGLKLAVDNAGAGFSSFQHLLELTPDIIKLDSTLVQELPMDSTRRALVNALVAFANESRGIVVAEGVETEAELQALKGTGVVLAQGFYVARPLSAAHNEERLRAGVLPLPRRPRAVS